MLGDLHEQLEPDVAVRADASRKVRGVNLEAVARVEIEPEEVRILLPLRAAGKVGGQPAVQDAADRSLAAEDLLPVAGVELTVGVIAQLPNDRVELRGVPTVVVVRSPPHEVLGRERSDITRIEPTAPKGLDERDAIVPVVVRHDVNVGGDERAQELAEGQIERRAVVQRTDAHREHVACRLGCFRAETLDEIGVHGAGREDAGSAGVEPEEV